MGKLVHYQYRPDANKYAGVGLEKDDWDVIKIRNKNLPIVESWNPIHVHCFEENPSEEGDFPSLSDYNELPVMSQRAWDALKPLIGKSCEALPIIHPSGNPYYIVHVMETIDCLDLGRAEVKRFSDGGVMRVIRYAFKPGLLQGKLIFKLPGESGGELLVNEEFRKVVESHDLKGLLFKEITIAE